MRAYCVTVVSRVTVIPVNREADQVIRVSKPVKQRIERALLRLQYELERPVTYSEMLGKAWDQVVYDHLFAALQEGGKS